MVHYKPDCLRPPFVVTLKHLAIVCLYALRYAIVYACTAPYMFFFALIPLLMFLRYCCVCSNLSLLEVCMLLRLFGR